MKRKIALAMVCVMIVSLSGCGKPADCLPQEDYSKYVTLCDYKGIETDKVKYEVSDEELQDAIKQNLYDYIEYEEVTDRGAEVGDDLVIDYASKMNGKEMEDYSGEEEEIVLGEGYIYPEVEEALKGMKTGESGTVTATLTEDFADDEDIGKKLEVNFTVKAVTQEIIPEYNLDFVKEYTDFKSLDQYEKAIKEELEESKKEEYDAYSFGIIMDYLTDNSTFNGYPQELYDEYEGYFNANNESTAAMFGMELDEFYEQWGIDEESKKQEIISNLNTELVIVAIAQAEGISCTDKEIDKFAKDNCEDFGYESTSEFFEDYSRKDVGFELIYEKVVDFLLKNAKYNEISEAEYMEKMEAVEDYEDAFEEEDSEIELEAPDASDDETDEAEEADEAHETEE